MNQLPGSLADPLHIDPPFPWGKALLAALLTLLVMYLLRRLWRAMRRGAQSLSAAKAQPAPARDGGIVGAINTLRRKYRTKGRIRQACHELSELLRNHFESARGQRFTTLTAGEIRRRDGDTRWARFFGLLTDLQFGRAQPERGDFYSLCDLALDAVSASNVSGRSGRGGRGGRDGRYDRSNRRDDRDGSDGNESNSEIIHGEAS